MTDALASTLARIVGQANVLTDPDLLASYTVDWTRRFHGRAAMVARPANTPEVVAIVRACSAAAAQIVTQGGNTGLVGGSIPYRGEVVLSTARMKAIGAFDTLAGEVTVDSGVTLADLNEAAGAHGLRLGVDLASRASATIGGMVATNAGGINVIRFGMMRAQIRGIECVLANGETIDRLATPLKDNTGFDLAHLLAGSEGTLAIITRVRLRLVPVLPATAVTLIPFDTSEEALAFSFAAKRDLSNLEAAEFFVADGLDLVRRHAGLSEPFARRHAIYVLLEVADRTDRTAEFAAFLDAQAGDREVLFATERADRDRLWAYRERHTESINAEGVPIKLDTAIPPANLGAFLARVESVARAAAPDCRPVLFGHIAEGSVHVNLLQYGDHEDEVTTRVLELVASLGGSISAEHGVGVAKTPWLALTRSPADIAAMRAIKNALDPAGMLNPGVIFSNR